MGGQADMALNKNKGWFVFRHTPWTWNFTRGLCRGLCRYCYEKCRYSRKLGPVEIVEKAFSDDLGAGRFIWICSTNEIGLLPPGALIRAADYAGMFDNWNQWVTKHPEGVLEELDKGLVFPEKSLLGLSLETNRIIPGIYGGPIRSPARRVEAFLEMKERTGLECIVVIDPVMDFDMEPFVKYIGRLKPRMVYFGKDTRGSGLPEPSDSKIEALFNGLGKFTRVVFFRSFERTWDKRRS
jgi:hypothetical protein